MLIDCHYKFGNQSFFWISYVKISNHYPSYSRLTKKCLCLTVEVVYHTICSSRNLKGTHFNWTQSFHTIIYGYRRKVLKLVHRRYENTTYVFPNCPQGHINFAKRLFSLYYTYRFLQSWVTLHVLKLITRKGRNVKLWNFEGTLFGASRNFFNQRNFHTSFFQYVLMVVLRKHFI